MVLLSREYNPNVYDSLGDVEQVSKLVPIREICNVGEIILKYDYQDSLTCIIAHRHFDLLPNEAMFEYMEGDASLAKPLFIDEISKSEAYPNVIALGRDQIWYPVNYSSGTFGIQAWNNDEFLSELAEFLQQNNLQDKIMIGARDKFSQFGNAKTMERNYKNIRTSEVRVANGEENENNAIQTTYVFSREPTENSITIDGTQGCTNCTHVCVLCACWKCS